MVISKNTRIVMATIIEKMLAEDQSVQIHKWVYNKVYKGLQGFTNYKIDTTFSNGVRSNKYSSVQLFVPCTSFLSLWANAKLSAIREHLDILQKVVNCLRDSNWSRVKVRIFMSRD